MIEAGVKNFPGFEINGKIVGRRILLSIADIEDILRRI